jgi:hypothetical protein
VVQGVSRDPIAPGHRPGGEERVHDRGLGRLGRGLEQGGRPVVRNHADVDHRADAVTTCLRAGEPAVAGRERQDEVARRVVRRAAHARETERGPLRQSVALVRQERGVRGHEDDDRPGAGLRDPGMVETLLLLVRAGHVGDRDGLADRHAVDPQLLPFAVVRLDQHADGPAAIRLRDDP